MLRWFLLDLNPEPWAIGPVGYARRGGKMSAYVGRNQQLDAYKEAVREALGPQEMIEGKVKVLFYFWRQMAEYTTPQARTHRKHEADTTNLQKSTEDALQGVLFSNDKDVRDIHSILVEQGPEVEGRIIIAVEKVNGSIPDAVALIPDEMHALMDVLDYDQPELPFEDEPVPQPRVEDVF